MSMPFVHKIAVGDLGEFWYGDYKEPFEQLEGAVPGYPKGVVLVDDAGRLLCAYCGKTYESLARHVGLHGLSGSQYKMETGLLQKSALVSERMRVRLVAVGRRNVASGRALTREHRAAALAAGPTRAPEVARGQLRPEYLNKTGRCYVQAIAVARSLAAQGRLNQKSLSAAGLSETTIRRYFTSVVNLRVQMGVALPGDSGKTGHAYADAQMLNALRSLALDLGRTPTTSDLRRFGLPSRQAYEAHFHSFRAACEQAGLDPRLPGSPTKGVDDVMILVAYATHGNYVRVARQLHVKQTRVVAVLARYGCPGLRNGRRNDSSERRAWAGDMARLLAGWPDPKEDDA